jgi:CubicO group peptidase (beta-lactamase class C family)
MPAVFSMRTQDKDIMQLQETRIWKPSRSDRRFIATARITLTVAFAICLVLPSSSGAAQNIENDKSTQIAALVSHYENCGYLNGAVLVAQHGEIIYAKGVGEANMEAHVPNTPQTRFGIASITKQFTAALTLQLAAQDKIRLDAKISEYLPWYRKDTGQRITIEHLLHHTSGLPADYDSPEFSDSAQAARHYEPQQFAERFCQPDLASQPGTKWAYSNCGYVLLGLILEKVSGKSFDDLLHEQILVPLGMKNTGLNRNDLAQSSGAIGYTRHAGTRYTPGPYLDQGHIFSAGAMYSTVEDLFLWNQALSSDKLFSKELREQIFIPGLGDWGYGWFVTRIPQGTPGAGNIVAEMRGDMPGNFFAWILRYPEQDAVTIVLRNGYGSTERFEQNLQAILFGQSPHLPSRSPKDIVAHAWFASAGWFAAHRLAIGIIVLALGIAVWVAPARRKPSIVVNRGGALDFKSHI